MNRWKVHITWKGNGASFRLALTSRTVVDDDGRGGGGGGGECR